MSEYTETKRDPAEAPARDDGLTPNRFSPDDVRGGLKHELPPPPSPST